MEDLGCLDQFIQNIDMQEWGNLAPMVRLEKLQQFENLMAQAQGRPACKVVAMQTDPNHMGSYNDEDRIIRINDRYLFGKSKINGASYFSLPNALMTIAHEGRHAWQHFVIDNPQLGMVDENTRLAIMMNCENYERGGILYGPQLIEMDARSYARGVLEHISQRILKIKGNVDTDFERAIIKNKNDEIVRGIKVFKDKTSKVQLAKAEEKARIRSKKLHPELDFSKVSYFRALKNLLDTGDFTTFSKLKPIERLDGKLDPKIDDGKTLKETKVHVKKKFV